MAVSLLILPALNNGLPWAEFPLVALVAAAFATWGGSRLLQGRSPGTFEFSLWCGCALIAAFGWVMTLFPGAWVDRSTGVIMELDKSPWLAFGTVDKAASTRAMLSISAALLIVVMAMDLGRERLGRVVLASSVITSGFAAAVAGLFLQTPADLSKLWQVKNVPDSVFGLFWYHGNAAAFLNLCWPAALWMCVKLLRREDRRPRHQLMIAGLVVMLAAQMVAVFANVSKMGHVLLVLQVIILAAAGFVVWRRLDEHGHETVGRRAWLLAGLAAALVLVGAWMAGASTGWTRWGVFAGRSFDDPARRHAAEMALEIGWDHGWNGTGPGTFEWVSAHYSVLDPVLKDGRWRHAHNDYAQFFAEWGWGGSLLALAVVALVATRCLQGLRWAMAAESVHHMSFQRRAGLLCLGSALLALAIHAVVDFPLQIPAIRCVAAALLGLMLSLTHGSLDRSQPGAYGEKKRRRRSSARAEDLPLAGGPPEGSNFF